MANLQDQLGLGLAVKQTAQQNNTPNYSMQNTNPLTWGVQLSAWRSIPFESQIDLWGGAPFNYWPGGGQDHTMDSIDYSGNRIASWYSTASSGVSAPASTSNIGIWDTFSWITPKRDKNIAQSTVQVGTIPPIWGVPTVPVSPTLDINQQQRLANIAKRQWVAGIQPPIVPTKPEISPTWLQGAELQAYNLLTPQEQKTFQALATQGIKAQTDYLAQSKAAQEYAKWQESISQDIEANRNAAEDIQARQQLESAAKSVANLKQNIGYIGTGGQPGVSSAKLDAVGQQVALANKTYDDVVKIDQLNKANRALGQESHALQFTRQMTQLQDDLDSKVNKGIQSALNQFNAAELKGKLDTIPEIEAFQQQLYAQLDGDLSSIMDTNIEARKFLIERYDKLAESQKTQMANAEKAKQEQEKRANSLNKDMSDALGYFVNDNGDPLIDQKTGQRIVVPPNTEKVFDKDSGTMMLVTTNRDGTISVDMRKVWPGKASTPEWKQDATTGAWVNTNSPVNPTQQQGGASWTRPTGNIVPVTAWNKTVRLDQAGASWFANAIAQLDAGNISIVVWQWERDQASTIKEMASRYGIPFNASNPAETAQKLRSAGHQVADPGKSNHESGMAIDVYGSSKLDAVSPAQERVLNANGWYSAGIPGDVWHFEYRGATGTQWPTIDNTSAYQKRLNTWALPTWMKEWTAKANEWLQWYTQWKQANNPLSESVQKRVDSYSDDYSKNVNVQSAFKFAPLLRQYDKIKVSDLSSSQRQGIISDYAKALDPDSVVREGEYATVAKYSSSFGEKTLSEINQFLSGNWTLSDAAAQKVIDAIKSRGKNYMEQEKNVRNQYIEKINRATGYKDGEDQIIYPDYATEESQKAKSDVLKIFPWVSWWMDFAQKIIDAINQK